MAQTTELLAETFYGPYIGGITQSPSWIEINLRRTGRDMAQLIREAKGLEMPTVIYPAGGYVLILKGYQDYQHAQMCFIHFSLDSEDFFVYFGAAFSPQLIKAIFETQQKIKSRGQDYQESVILTDEL
ncbi:hypothetical protein [Spirosoma litoris]